MPESPTHGPGVGLSPRSAGGDGDRLALADGLGLRQSEVLAADVREARHADQRKAAVYLVRQDAEDVIDAVLAAGAQAVDVRPADEHRLRTERHRLHDVAAPADAAV